MPRLARNIIPDIPMHITQRGNRRENIFLDDEDKEFYLRSFMKYRKILKVKVFAWCLMDNHVHFILQPSNKKGLSKLFLCLNTKYVRYFNKKYGITGKLLGDRFFSCLLDEEHLYEAIRYVELNPYKAKKESVLGEYKWSSIAEHLGNRCEYFLNKLPEYLDIKNWKAYLTENIAEIKENISLINQKWAEIRSATIKNFPIGSFDFIATIEKLLKKEFNFNPRGRPVNTSLK